MIKRRAPTQVNQAGQATLRVTIPRSIWEVCKAFGLQLDLSPEKSLDLLLHKIGGLIAEHDDGFLGPDWRLAAKSARQDNLNELHDGPKIEIEKLHRSPKTRSGFVGVYANGKGFRAMGRNPNGPGELYLGTCETAEAAAWKRYLHHKANGLPYGPLEIEIETYRKNGATGTDEEVIALIREDATRLGYAHELFPDVAPPSPEAFTPSDPKMLGFTAPPVDPDKYR